MPPLGVSRSHHPTWLQSGAPTRRRDPGQPPRGAAGLTSGGCRRPGTPASRCELRGEERGAARLEGVSRVQHPACAHPQPRPPPGSPTLDLVEVTGLLLGEKVGMRVLAGIHLVHEEGAEPAALGLPRVPPGRQRVSAGRGAPAGTPTAGGGNRRPRLPHRPAPGGAPSVGGGGASLRVVQFTAGRGWGVGPLFRGYSGKAKAAARPTSGCWRGVGWPPAPQGTPASPGPPSAAAPAGSARGEG